jgi:hypothetical protein
LRGKAFEQRYLFMYLIAVLLWATLVHYIAVGIMALINKNKGKIQKAFISD